MKVEIFNEPDEVKSVPSPEPTPPDNIRDDKPVKGKSMIGVVVIILVIVIIVCAVIYFIYGKSKEN